MSKYAWNLIPYYFQPFKSPFWLTFLQCKNLGGKVKAGEKSRIVIYWEKNIYEDESTGKLEKSILSKVYFVQTHILRMLLKRKSQVIKRDVKSENFLLDAVLNIR